MAVTWAVAKDAWYRGISEGLAYLAALREQRIEKLMREWNCDRAFAERYIRETR
jgi:hypothetical protein